MAGVSPELLDLQERIEHLDPTTDLTREDADALFNSLNSLFNNIKGQYPAHSGDSEPAFGSWPIPDTNSSLTRTQLTTKLPVGRGFRFIPSGDIETQVQHIRGPNNTPRSVTITTRQQSNSIPISVFVEGLGLSRSFNYTFPNKADSPQN